MGTLHPGDRREITLVRRDQVLQRIPDRAVCSRRREVEYVCIHGLQCLDHEQRRPRLVFEELDQCLIHHRTLDTKPGLSHPNIRARDLYGQAGIGRTDGPAVRGRGAAFAEAITKPLASSMR